MSSFILLLSIGIANVSENLLQKYLGLNVANQIKTNIADPYKQIGEFVPNDYRPYFLPILICIALFLFLISKLINKLHYF